MTTHPVPDALRLVLMPDELTPEMEQVWRSAFISQGHLRRNAAGRLKHSESCERAAYRALRKFVSKSAVQPAAGREEIARIIDPSSFSTQYFAHKGRVADALAKADAILADISTPAQASGEPTGWMSLTALSILEADEESFIHRRQKMPTDCALYAHPPAQASETGGEAADVLLLFREFVQRNVTQWKLGAGHHHPMWGLIADTLGDRNDEPIVTGPRWAFIQPENRAALSLRATGREMKLTPTQQRVLDRLRDGPLSAKDFASAEVSNDNCLKVHINALRNAGVNIRTDRGKGQGRPGVYHLVLDPNPPFQMEYDAMAQSMGVA